MAVVAKVVGGGGGGREQGDGCGVACGQWCLVGIVLTVALCNAVARLVANVHVGKITVFALSRQGYAFKTFGDRFFLF